MPRRTTPAQARKAALRSDLTPLYAVAGLTDVLAGAIRSTEAQLVSRASAVTGYVKALPASVRHLPEISRTGVLGARRSAESPRGEAAGAYGDLAGRGKLVVDEALRSARTLSTAAERRAEEVRTELVEVIDPALEKLQEGVTVTRQRVTGRTSTDTVTPRSAAKAAASRARTSATTGSPSRPTTTAPATGKSATGKSATGKSATGKSATGKSATASAPRTPAKRAAAAGRASARKATASR